MGHPVTRTALLVVNPTAGGGRARHLRPAVAETLRQAGWAVRAIASRDAEDAVRIGAEADVDELLVSLGGDGTHALLARGAATSGAALAPLPGGRGNDLVRALQLPADAVRAARAVTRRPERSIGLGMAQDTAFLGVLSIGFSAMASQRAATSRLRGPATYQLAAARALLAVPRLGYRLTVDGQTREWCGYELAVGHSGWYGGGLHVCPTADLGDDLLDVTAISAPKYAFPAVLAGMFSGRHVRRADVTTLRGHRITVAADRDGDDQAREVWADGDRLGRLPVTAWVRPAALRLRG